MELVKTARSVIAECLQDTPAIGAPKYTEPESVWEILDRKTQPVKLLRGSWVIKYASSDGQHKGFPRRQDLEETLGAEAFIPRVQVECEVVYYINKYINGKCMNVVSVSYCCRAAKHPDADGQQLRTVASKFERLLQQKLFSQHFSDAGIFWDFCSLYQKDKHNRRTQIEQQVFDEALRDMSIWYLHALVMTYIVNMKVAGEPSIDYESRGWTHFERSCAELIKPTFAGGGFAVYDQWPMITEFGEAHRKLPLSPDMFAEELAHKRFTSRGDKEIVVRSYVASFMYAVRGKLIIDFNAIKIQNPDDVKRLASALQHCCSAEELKLHKMDIGDDGVGELVHVLPRMSSLRNVYLAENKIGDAGATAIASVLPHTQWMGLYLSFNHLGDVGASAIATALPSVPGFRNLSIDGNKVGDVGAIAIANVLPSMLALATINLCANTIGDAGAIAIANVLPRMSKEFWLLDIQKNLLTEGGKELLQQAATSSQTVSVN